ncbi:MAG: hypothetical protein H0W03_09500 [Solirubrobacterales bacterium]|nr:hypothetical protein [Solirubrobacterales bacterium]
MSTQTESTRPTALEIYQRALKDGADELERPVRALAISGLFTGLTIGATPLAVAFAPCCVRRRPGRAGPQRLAAIQVEAALLEGEVAVGDWLGWLATTVAGNAVGGVVIVTLFNYGQVRAPRG